MKRLLPLLGCTLLLAACVDTTGLSAELSKPAKGNPQAVVVVTEYADLECPACRAANSVIVKPLLEKYGSQIRFEYKHFPLRSIHRYTMELAEAAECAADQGKFWEFVDLAFENQPNLGKGKAREWAQTLGIDMELFDRCADSHVKEDAIMAEYDAGRELDVRGTPTFFVNDKQVQSTLEDISAAVDQELQGASQRL